MAMTTKSSTKVKPDRLNLVAINRDSEGNEKKMKKEPRISVR
jgi:hypothetical protein